MMIYLKHPDHGKKIAYMEQEAIDDKKNGWVEYNPDEEAKNAPKSSKSVENESANETVEQTEELENGVQEESQREGEEAKVNRYLDKDELKAALDAAGIPYRKNASREVLVNLLEEANGRANAD
jgi:hypothetical protein